MDGKYLLLMALCYLVTVAIETAVLLVGLSRRHRLRTRLLAGFWLTACTYPIVWIVLPELCPTPEAWLAYLLLAEVFVAIAECLLFYFAFIHPTKDANGATKRDMIAIVAANLVSFVVGEWGIRELLVSIVQ